MTAHWQARRSGPSPQRPGDRRTPWQRDRARVLHSAAFRRLQSKTQIMNVGENDFYRTRLTHSLEAAQIGASLINQLHHIGTEQEVSMLPDLNLMETLCLAHDIGHPPFGHGGETALNFKMLAAGGFEGNGQTFRIVGKLEAYHPEHGMDLTRRTLLGLLKYPVLMPELPVPVPASQPGSLAQWRPAKALFSCDADLLDWVLEPLSKADKDIFQEVETLSESPWQRSKHKSLDASLMELADDIAYGVHDLEDAVVTGTLSESQWHAHLDKVVANLDSSLADLMRQLGRQLFSSQHSVRKDAIGALVNIFVTAVHITEVSPETEEPLIRFNACLPESERYLLDSLKKVVFEHVINQPAIQQLRYRSQNMLLNLFTAFHTEPMRLLPDNTRIRWQAAYNEKGQAAADRILCDYIAGMTDDYAERMYRNLYVI
ncbi:Deoxyguanosinetriphosphate triphosphohydrolase-like protein [Pseudidiomarina piscicola]|uniref:Deoxyguanosinetriphosphate triphosphohydrolase-like protein n=1 Tax=Pseudidiomarina piscicola TaxID=2614830 RepID=A0A6S6WQK4_9GAMM|nr:anti-phage deoxyguanosine triphosphatase [Pseudidiomarina piscicola]CAB0151333.1 Deoxyguanosinetriphosphate triphosphohydrolase-like protein [Pseudidiomarina piscicola]VZT40814.1 Deoxyguanosinetriphosphate triphosphohydrolase-like protein [Pseudomonas aeruginosa]